MVKINVTNESLIPMGSYGARVDRVIEHLDKSNVEVVWVISADPSGGSVGKDITDYLSWKNAGAQKRLKLVCRRLGVQVPETGEFDFQPQSLVLRTATIDVIHEEYKDERKVRIAYGGVHQGVQPKGPGQFIDQRTATDPAVVAMMSSAPAPAPGAAPQGGGDDAPPF